MEHGVVRLTGQVKQGPRASCGVGVSRRRLLQAGEPGAGWGGRLLTQDPAGRLPGSGGRGAGGEHTGLCQSHWKAVSEAQMEPLSSPSAPKPLLCSELSEQQFPLPSPRRHEAHSDHPKVSLQPCQLRTHLHSGAGTWLGAWRLVLGWPCTGHVACQDGSWQLAAISGCWPGLADTAFRATGIRVALGRQGVLILGEVQGWPGGQAGGTWKARDATS